MASIRCNSRFSDVHKDARGSGIPRFGEQSVDCAAVFLLSTRNLRPKSPPMLLDRLADSQIMHVLPSPRSQVIQPTPFHDRDPCSSMLVIVIWRASFEKRSGKNPHVQYAFMSRQVRAVPAYARVFSLQSSNQSRRPVLLHTNFNSMLLGAPSAPSKVVMGRERRGASGRTVAPLPMGRTSFFYR